MWFLAYIFTHHSQIVCLMNMQCTLWYINMPDVTAGNYIAYNWGCMKCFGASFGRLWAIFRVSLAHLWVVIGTFWGFLCVFLSGYLLTTPWYGYFSFHIEYIWNRMYIHNWTGINLFKIDINMKKTLGKCIKTFQTRDILWLNYTCQNVTNIPI